MGLFGSDSGVATLDALPQSWAAVQVGVAWVVIEWQSPMTRASLLVSVVLPKDAAIASTSDASKN